MQNITKSYSGIYSINDVDHIVFGSWTSIPASETMPAHISVTWTIRDQNSDNSSYRESDTFFLLPPTNYSAALWRIGKFVNQRLDPVLSKFSLWLREFVSQDYINHVKENHVIDTPFIVLGDHGWIKGDASGIELSDGVTYKVVLHNGFEFSGTAHKTENEDEFYFSWDKKDSDNGAFLDFVGRTIAEFQGKQMRRS